MRANRRKRAATPAEPPTDGERFSFRGSLPVNRVTRSLAGFLRAMDEQLRSEEESERIGRYQRGTERRLPSPLAVLRQILSRQARAFRRSWRRQRQKAKAA